MKLFSPASDMPLLSRREAFRALATTAALHAFQTPRVNAAEKDSLPMQFYKSLTEEQHAKICLPLLIPSANS